MPISGTGRSTEPATAARARSGFTLIELVVVIALVSVLSIAAMLSLGSGIVTDRGAQAPAALVDAVTAARDRALLGRSALGLVARADGWVVVARNPDGDGWFALEPRGAARPPLRWVVDGAVIDTATPVPADAPLVPVVIFATDGRSQAFSVRFAFGGPECVTDGWEALQCAR